MKRVLTTVLPCVFALSCNSSEGLEPVETIRFLMDTAVRITVYDGTRASEDLSRIMDEAFDLMESIEVKTSRYDGASDVARVCRAAGDSSVIVSGHAYDVFQAAAAVSRETGGAFDVSVAAVQALWGFFTDHPGRPDAGAVERRLESVDYRRIALDSPRVGLDVSGMSVDLGGAAKGYAVDRVVEFLEESGIEAGIVDAGGDLRIFGAHPRRPEWRIGIRHPRSDEGRLFGVIGTQATSIATSGDYERYFVEDGIRYHHILDPRTGQPARGCVSATVVAEEALLADAYATAVFVLGPEAGMRLIESKQELEGMIVWEENGSLSHAVSSGLLPRLQLVEERGT